MFSVRTKCNDVVREYAYICVEINHHLFLAGKPKPDELNFSNFADVKCIMQAS